MSKQSELDNSSYSSTPGSYVYKYTWNVKQYWRATSAMGINSDVRRPLRDAFDATVGES